MKKFRFKTLYVLLSCCLSTTLYAKEEVTIIPPLIPSSLSSGTTLGFTLQNWAPGAGIVFYSTMINENLMPTQVGIQSISNNCNNRIPSATGCDSHKKNCHFPGVCQVNVTFSSSSTILLNRYALQVRINTRRENPLFSTPPFTTTLTGSSPTESDVLYTAENGTPVSLEKHMKKQAGGLYVTTYTNGAWQFLGSTPPGFPSDARPSALAASQNNVYVAGSFFDSGLAWDLYSYDLSNGLTGNWTALTNPAGTNHAVIAALLVDNGILYTGGGSGQHALVYSSSDGGTTWQQVCGAPAWQSVESPSTVTALAVYNNKLYAGGNYNLANPGDPETPTPIIASCDLSSNSSTWAVELPVSTYSGDGVVSFAVNQGIIYATISSGPTISSNGGAWLPLSDQPPASPYSLAFNQNILYGASGNFLYYYTPSSPSAWNTIAGVYSINNVFAGPVTGINSNQSSVFTIGPDAFTNIIVSYLTAHVFNQVGDLTTLISGGGEDAILTGAPAPSSFSMKSK